jgi:transcriptional regulator with XRE-family HTH domain
MRAQEGITFGGFFRRMRERSGKSLRQFCLENGFDAGNISKLERDRLQPPQSQEKLEEYATALGIVRGSDEWYEFFDLAHIGAGRIPPALLADKEVAARLPLVFRTLRRQPIDGDDVEDLIELIRRD